LKKTKRLVISAGFGGKYPNTWIERSIQRFHLRG
jgi:hypothetical protein